MKTWIIDWYLVEHIWDFSKFRLHVRGTNIAFFKRVRYEEDIYTKSCFTEIDRPLVEYDSEFTHDKYLLDSFEIKTISPEDAILELLNEY